MAVYFLFFFFQAEDGIRDGHVTGVQTCALPISRGVGGRSGGIALCWVELGDCIGWISPRSGSRDTSRWSSTGAIPEPCWGSASAQGKRLAPNSCTQSAVLTS